MLTNVQSDSFSFGAPVTWIGVLAAVPALRNVVVMICGDASPLQALLTL